MPRWKSAIISRSVEVYHHDLLDSHNDLVDLFKLKKEDHWTPIEFIPGEDWFNLDTYRFTFDAERPTWADDEWLESATNKMRKIVERYIVHGDNPILVGGAYLFAGDSKVAKVVGGRVLAAQKVANLYGANLKGANLEWANLEGANLEVAYRGSYSTPSNWNKNENGFLHKAT